MYSRSGVFSTAVLYDAIVTEADTRTWGRLA